MFFPVWAELFQSHLFHFISYKKCQSTQSNDVAQVKEIMRPHKAITEAATFSIFSTEIMKISQEWPHGNSISTTF